MSGPHVFEPGDCVVCGKYKNHEDHAALLAEPVPQLAPLFDEALAATVDLLRSRAYVVQYRGLDRFVVDFSDVHDALAAHLTDPKGETDG